MGMLDQEVMFSDAQAANGMTAGDNPSTNAYNTGGANGQGDASQTGENLWITIRVNAALTSGGAATIQGVLQSSPDNATWTDAVSGPATTVANAIAGTDLLRTQPPATGRGLQQYWRTVTRVAAAALTGGTIDSYVSNTVERNIARASGIPAVG